MSSPTVLSPVRDALEDESSLHPKVMDGLGAMKPKDKDCIDPAIRCEFQDSLDTDLAFIESNRQDHRWDYLLGHDNQILVAVEPHSAKTDEISVVIRKRDALQQQMSSHLKGGKGISKWLWVASGRTDFQKVTQAQRKLSQHGITFVGRQVKAKHLS
jgi:hypothetical protein